MRASDTRRESDVLTAKTILGTRVRNSQGEDLGTIEDLAMDVDSGRMAYAVLSFGGFLGLGDKLFAIPMDALQLSVQAGALTADRVFVLNIDKDRLRDAPGFDKNDWPNMADRSWGAEIYNYYGYRPYW